MASGNWTGDFRHVLLPTGATAFAALSLLEVVSPAYPNKRVRRIRYRGHRSVSSALTLGWRCPAGNAVDSATQTGVNGAGYSTASQDARIDKPQNLRGSSK